MTETSFLFDESLKNITNNFQAYSKDMGQHPIEFIANTYWSVIKNFKKSKIISSYDLMTAFRNRVEKISGKEVLCNTEIYDYLTALKSLGGNKKYKLPSDFELIIDDAKKKEERFKNLMKLAKKIVKKEKNIFIDDSTELNTIKHKGDAFIYT